MYSLWRPKPPETTIPRLLARLTSPLAQKRGQSPTADQNRRCLVGMLLAAKLGAGDQGSSSHPASHQGMTAPGQSLGVGQRVVQPWPTIIAPPQQDVGQLVMAQGRLEVAFRRLNPSQEAVGYTNLGRIPRAIKRQSHPDISLGLWQIA